TQEAGKTNVPSKTLRELNEELAVKTRALQEVFTEAGPDMDMDKVSKISGDSHQKAAEIRRLNTELSAVGTERDAAAELHTIAENARKAVSSLPVPVTKDKDKDKGQERAAFKSIEERIKESPAIKAHVERGMGMKELAAAGMPFLELSPSEYKALVSLTSISPQNERRPGIIEMAVENRTVADLLMEGTTTRPVVEYYTETALPTAAGAVAEGAVKPESTFAWAPVTEPVSKIGHWVPVTDEALADVPGLEGIVRNRLAWGVTRKEENDILNGTGTAPALRGLLNRTGIQTQAKGTDPIYDAIFKGLQKVRNIGFADPTAVVMHTDVWTQIRLTTTADGLYIYGNPMDAGPERIFGLPIRQTSVMPVNTALVLSREYAQVTRRTGITVTASSENATNFVENKVTILAEERVGLEVYRAAAFCSVTGLV
ncbi:MAG TPA: phage major capsid protein, partial [Chloroflexota bacterium]|nr:phage major capsid protein [Chloroflexota bacterium]